jgi:hypothetical protein
LADFEVDFDLTIFVVDFVVVEEFVVRLLLGDMLFLLISGASGLGCIGTVVVVAGKIN